MRLHSSQSFSDIQSCWLHPIQTLLGHKSYQPEVSISEQTVYYISLSSSTFQSLSASPSLWWTHWTFQTESHPGCTCHSGTSSRKKTSQSFSSLGTKQVIYWSFFIYSSILRKSWCLNHCNKYTKNTNWHKKLQADTIPSSFSTNIYLRQKHKLLRLTLIS